MPHSAGGSPSAQQSITELPGVDVPRSGRFVGPTVCGWGWTRKPDFGRQCGFADLEIDRQPLRPGRKIPGRNVIYLDDVPDSETTDLAGFRNRIMQPIFQQMEERRLGNIDYIVYSADFPTAISVSEHLEKLQRELEKRNESELINRQFYLPQGSINSLTFFAGAVMTDNPFYVMLDANTYYRQPAQAILRRPFTAELQSEFEDAIAAFKTEEGPKYDQAIQKLEELVRRNPRQVAALYWLARFYGQQGNAGKATFWLKQAVRSGWSFRTQTQSDLAFGPVQQDTNFASLVAKIPDLPFDFVTTLGFKHEYAWGPNGYLNSEPKQGNRYFLSTVLAATRGHGNTEKEAVRQLSLSMKADETYPAGTFYFSDTTDIRNQTRKPNYQFAIDALNTLGHDAEIINTPLPVAKRDVLGLSTGAASFSWVASGSKFVHGAIADNLTSYGGRLSEAGQTKLSEFLRHNAAGASGTVIEPFALQAKFPHPLIHVHYARGCTLAESFYQAVQSPFQLLIVGDARFVNRLRSSQPSKSRESLQAKRSKGKSSCDSMQPNHLGRSVNSSFMSTASKFCKARCVGRSFLTRQGFPTVTTNCVSSRWQMTRSKPRVESLCQSWLITTAGLLV